MNEANQKMSADDIEALLPWYAAGTLDAREADQVEAAVAADVELARRLDVRDSAGALVDFNRTHRFRHTVATNLLNSGVPIHVLQRYMGHLTPAMTMHYAQTLQSTAEAAMMQLTVGSAERRVLERVTTEVDRMRSTLDALLRIALAETGTVAREPVNLSELVASVVELYAPVSDERGIILESSVASGAEVLGSRQLLAQALANLLDNAIKFTPDGGHIRVQLRGSASEPEVIVEDNGPGIPADKREIVLGRRVRLDEARKFPGSGLGLSLVAAVTKLHGAHLVLDDAGPGLRVSLKF